MTKVIDMLLVQWNEKYTTWKTMPDVITNDITAVEIHDGNMENIPVQKKELRSEIDEIVEAVMILKQHQKPRYS